MAIESRPVQSLLIGVQRSLQALAPIAADLGVHWREPASYEDWGLVAAGVFGGFVIEAVRSSREFADFLPLLPYDRRIDDYSAHSCIAVARPDGWRPLICLETKLVSFDTCLVAEVGQDLKVAGTEQMPFDACRFAVLGRLTSGKSTIVETLTW